MSLYKYLIILLIGTILSWGAWLAVLFFMNPLDSGMLSLFCFYATLALSLVGTFSIVGFIVRMVLKKEVMEYKHINMASRQSVLFTVLVIVALLMQSQRWLMWWSLIVLVLITGFIELFFLSYKKFDR